MFSGTSCNAFGVFLLVFLLAKTCLNTFFSSAEPIFLVRPEPEKVGLNGVATFFCQAAGSPQPTIFWTKEVGAG